MENQLRESEDRMVWSRSRNTLDSNWRLVLRNQARKGLGLLLIPLHSSEPTCGILDSTLDSIFNFILPPLISYASRNRGDNLHTTSPLLGT